MGVINCNNCDHVIDLDYEQEFYPPEIKVENQDLFENAICEKCYIEKYPDADEENLCIQTNKGDRI